MKKLLAALVLGGWVVGAGALSACTSTTKASIKFVGTVYKAEELYVCASLLSDVDEKLVTCIAWEEFAKTLAETKEQSL